MIRPISEANLYPCAEPSATSTPGWSGTASRTKSRSGVSVYRQVFVRNGSPGHVRQVGREERVHPREGRLVTLERAGRRGDPPPADVLADLGPRVPVRGKAVERGLVHPDPDREPVGGEPRRIPARREPADLLLGDRERQGGTERLEEVVRPGVGGDDDPAGGQPLAVLEDHDRLPRRVVDPRDGRVLAQHGAVFDGQAPVGDVAARRVGEPAVGLEQAQVPVVEPPGRPAAGDLGPVQLLERDALGGHRPRVLADVDGDARGRLARAHVEAARAEHDLRAALALDLGPRLVRPGGQPHVVAAMVGAPDDPAHVLRCAVVVPDLVPLEGEDPRPGPPRGPIGGGGPERPEPHDDDVPVARHARPP